MAYEQQPGHYEEQQTPGEWVQVGNEPGTHVPGSYTPGAPIYEYEPGEEITEYAKNEDKDGDVYLREPGTTVPGGLNVAGSNYTPGAVVTEEFPGAIRGEDGIWRLPGTWSDVYVPGPFIPEYVPGDWVQVGVGDDFTVTRNLNVSQSVFGSINQVIHTDTTNGFQLHMSWAPFRPIVFTLRALDGTPINNDDLTVTVSGHSARFVNRPFTTDGNGRYYLSGDLSLGVRVTSITITVHGEAIFDFLPGDWQDSAEREPGTTVPGGPNVAGSNYTPGAELTEYVEGAIKGEDGVWRLPGTWSDVYIPGAEIVGAIKGEDDVWRLPGETVPGGPNVTGSNYTPGAELTEYVEGAIKGEDGVWRLPGTWSDVYIPGPVIVGATNEYDGYWRLPGRWVPTGEYEPGTWVDGMYIPGAPIMRYIPGPIVQSYVPGAYVWVPPTDGDGDVTPPAPGEPGVPAAPATPAVPLADAAATGPALEVETLEVPAEEEDGVYEIEDPAVPLAPPAVDDYDSLVGIPDPAVPLAPSVDMGEIAGFMTNGLIMAALLAAVVGGTIRIRKMRAAAGADDDAEDPEA